MVAGTQPQKGGTDWDGKIGILPIYPSVVEAKNRAAAAIEKAIDAEIGLITCITEVAPYRTWCLRRLSSTGPPPGSSGPIAPV